MQRDALIRELRKIARERGLVFEVFENGGKVAFFSEKLGAGITTIQSGDLSKLHVRSIMKQLGMVP